MYSLLFIFIIFSYLYSISNKKIDKKKEVNY